MSALEKRQLRVLRLFYEYPLALPKRPAFVNLRREYSYSLTEETSATRIDELVEAGYLDFLDIGHGYYVINQTGEKYFEENRHKLAFGEEI